MIEWFCYSTIQIRISFHKYAKKYASMPLYWHYEQNTTASPNYSAPTQISLQITISNTKSVILSW